jgi:endoglucanase
VSRALCSGTLIFRRVLLYRSNRLVFLALACSLPGLGGCSVLFPSNENVPPPPAMQWDIHAVRANSVGYLMGREKTVTVVLPSGMTALTDASADVRSAANDSVVWSCALTGPTADTATNTIVYAGDFTPFDEAGDFYIAVPSLDVDGKPARSATFHIGPDVFREALSTAMLAMYGQRCGMAVKVQVGDQHWSHAACHQNDAFLNYLTGAATKKPSLGGWHDAGDYGKYVTNGAFSAGMMLAAWEHFQPMLSTLQIPAIPEHGRGVPDFLAEVKWELDWLLTTQADDGSVSHKVTALDFEGFVMPEKDGSMRYYTPVGTAATGDLVAVLAQAARVYRPYDQAQSDKYLEAARKGYTFLATTTAPPTPDISDTFKTGGYGQSSDAGNRLWAAAELWETTGEAPFLADLEAGIGTPSVDASFDWGTVRNLGLFTYLLSKRDGRDPTLLAGLTTSATTVADTLTTTAQTAPFGRAISGYWWGSNGSVARTAMNLWVAYQLNGATKYLDTIAMQLDHLLGRNFYDRTQVTGLGYHPPEQPHHRPSVADGVTPPWPGLLVGGTNPGATTWKDDSNAYQVNEVAINWVAAFVYATAALTPVPAP